MTSCWPRGQWAFFGPLSARKNSFVYCKSQSICDLSVFLFWQCAHILQWRKQKKKKCIISVGQERAVLGISVPLLGVNQWFINLKYFFVLFCFENQVSDLNYTRENQIIWLKEGETLVHMNLGTYFFSWGGIAIRDLGCWEHACDLVLPVLRVLVRDTG